MRRFVVVQALSGAGSSVGTTSTGTVGAHPLNDLCTSGLAAQTPDDVLHPGLQPLAAGHTSTGTISVTNYLGEGSRASPRLQP